MLLDLTKDEVFLLHQILTIERLHFDDDKFNNLFEKVEHLKTLIRIEEIVAGEIDLRIQEHAVLMENIRALEGSNLE